MEAQGPGLESGPLDPLGHLSLASVVLAIKWDVGQMPVSVGRPSPQPPGPILGSAPGDRGRRQSPSPHQLNL